MVQLATKSTALVLYAVLVVLPAVVFGGLHGHQLSRDHADQLQALPAEAESAAQRIVAGIRTRLDDLLIREESRDFYYYQRDYYPENATADVAFVESPLVQGIPPEGVLAWFAYDFLELLDGHDAHIEIFAGDVSGRSSWAEEEADLTETVYDLSDMDAHERAELRWTRHDELLVKTMPLHAVAINRSPQRDPDCLRDGLQELIRGEDGIEIRMSSFNLRFLRSRDGAPRIVATRRVRIEPQSEWLPDCFESLGGATYLVQGIFIDPQWLFRTMPTSVAFQVLDHSQRLLFAGHDPQAISPTDHVAQLHIFEELAIEVPDPADRKLGLMKVAIDSSELEQRFRAQSWRFVGVAGMMIISLAIGMGLLVRSVHASLEQARRTENFVAAVTHELRTPIAAVKLYGEMLKDGWISSREKQEDYLERIVRETDRLDGLVDRVLEKRRLGLATPTPRPGDLNALIEEQVPDLELSAGTYGGDVVFELEPDLPPVLLTPEGVRSVLSNLVENARKYAPMDPGATDPTRREPIRVITRTGKGRVLLEVLDRGPGIPEAENGRIFEAFYRVGDERTRTTAGTGLGLHLVALQARAMRARIQALPRPGGGSVFRVTFRTARA